MIALRLVRLIEGNSDKIARNVVARIQASPLTGSLQKVPPVELQAKAHDLLQHLGDWLLTKTEKEIANNYREIGARRAGQGVEIAHVCWALIITRECLWEFLQEHEFVSSPIDIYGEMELLRLLNRFFDHALCYTIEGYSQAELVVESGKKKHREINLAMFVP